ncbi:hypothetical protein ACFV1L_20190 [Kitasatospora sp. NPDC059646]|uniref:TRAFAC clade GTPase domain-containing protein n=1 Tax=Kitasatospora sp. NPDC059646 TaxID=3346893 RepID=UPI0036D1A881
MIQVGQVVQWAGIALGGFVSVTAALTVLRTGPEFYGVAALTAGRALGPWQAGRDDARVPLPGGAGEPAHRSYWWRQVWVDAGHALLAGVAEAWERLTEDWLAERAWRMMLGRSAKGGPVRNGLGRKLARLVGAGVALGAVLGALLAAAVVLVLAVLFALLLGAACLGAGALAGVLNGLGRILPRLRGIRPRCPYPGCWEAVPLPVYRCPNCPRTHRALRPGRYGVLRRVCQCGSRVPLGLFGGRPELEAYCPHCDRQLPGVLGRAPLVHLPLLGADSAGKTMFLMAAVRGLQALAAPGVSVGFGTAEDRDRYEHAERQLDGGAWVNSTADPLPQAFLLVVSRGRRRRLVYLYDPMGETVRNEASLRDQRYLAHADALVLVCDVLAEPEVRRSLTPADAALAGAARPAREGPGDTAGRLVGEFGPRPRRRRTPVAVVVTKRDVLDGLSALPVAPRGDVREWLGRIGLAHLVQLLANEFGGHRAWAVSARAATAPGAGPEESRLAAEPLLWLLARRGLRLGDRPRTIGGKA